MSQLKTPSAWMAFWWKLCFSLALVLGSTGLLAQSAVRNFDHLKTGFALTGFHTNVRCESCHIKGVFKGTPRDCASCHAGTAPLAIANVVKPQKHVPTQQACETCHSTATFTGAKFNHAGITPNACASCHNGNISNGKPANHIPTQADCSTCHKSTSSWQAAKPDHSTFTTATNCASCHNGTAATGKIAAHIPTTLNCISCHSVTAFKPSNWNHSQMPVANQCSTCHSGANPPADGPTANHIPYKSLSGVAIANCDTCHKSGFAAWNPGTFHNNVSVSTQCATCHINTSFGVTGKPATSIHATVTGNCESCHKSTTTWLGGKPDHSQFTTATNCASCHNGTAATGKIAAHIPTTLNCISCHSVTAFKPSNWNHTQMPVANQCSTCHSGANPPADGPTTNHIPYKSLSGVAIANCDSCHKSGFAAWNPGTFHNNVTVSTQCATCHINTSFGVTGKPATPIHATVTGNCESCHKTTKNWQASKPDHSLFTLATNCASCHNGSTATGKIANHIPTSLNCISCHSVTAFKPSNWNHSQMPVASQCSTCHSGANPPADGPTTNHIPYKSLSGVAITNCDTCHKSGFVAWNPGTFHNNVAVSTQCATCHINTSFGVTGKPATSIHATVTGNCESCHKSTSTWLGSKPDHSLFTTATNCATCHNGSTATGKIATHIPTTLNCISCHTVTAFKPSNWNHTQMPVANQCSTCHSGANPPADGPTTNHIPYKSLSGVAIANCDTCHKSGFAAWNPGTFHNNVTVSTQCATCHINTSFGVTGKPATPIHATVTGNCESCHKSTATWLGSKPDHSLFTTATNCATCHNGAAATGKTAAHIPTTLNCISCHSVTAFKPSNWNHTQMPVANQCSTCHSGASPPADGPTTNHIPYKSLSGVAITNCDTCHKSGFVAWNPGTFHNNVAVSTQCATCHINTSFGVTGKPATSIHATVTGNCESCHKSTSTWLGSKPDHSLFTTATNCASCHNGAAATGKIATHIPTTVNCVSCHNVTAWKPTKWNHSQMPVANQCSTCHTGGYAPALGRPANHIPYQSLSGVAITNCDTCHKSGYTGWFPGKFHSSVSLSTQCATCHINTSYGVTGKPATPIHASVTGNCESCHKSTSTWLGGKPDHSLFTSATNCASCHNGSAATGKIATHIPTTVNCVSCHNITGWKPTKWNHTQMPVTNQCSTCHTGGYTPALGRPLNHIPYQSLSGVAITNCDTCHKTGFATWFPGKFHSSVSLSTQCATCHLSSMYGVTSKPATAIHATVTGNCESCHKSTATWLGGKPDHSLFTAATNCATCHNGSAATGKVATHIPTTLNCISCHTVTSFRPNTWKHTQMPVTNQCGTCHTGGYYSGLGRPLNHIPYLSLSGVAITNCDTCHKTGFATWFPGKFHSSVSITTQCATCHLTGSYGLTSKPATATHATVTGNCETCHKSTTSWLTVTYVHAPANAVGTGTCDTCHNGTSSTIVSKPVTHIPVPAGVAKCDSCHRSQVNFRTAVTMNHSVVTTATCASCHNGSYLSAGTQGALTTPANHIPYKTQLLNGATLDCKACHSSTTSWLTEKMNHNGSTGSGAGWCKSCHATGTTYLGVMQKMALNHRGGATVKVDCSQSGCHRPLGNTGTTYIKWN